MKLVVLSFACLVITLSFADEVNAKGWRGIVPLHSTRADVIRLFGQCLDRQDECRFEVGNEEVYIDFLEDIPAGLSGCGNKLPAETVMRILVEHREPVSFKFLRLNKNVFRSFEIGSSYKGYINRTEGLVIQTSEGKVSLINYIASARDARLCPSYYEDPESFVRVFPCSLPPPVYIRCPTTDVVDGDRIELSADAPPDEKLLFTWSITAGKIFGGDGTRKIMVDTIGLGGNTLTATVEMNDGNQHTANASCTVKVLPKPDPDRLKR